MKSSRMPVRVTWYLEVLLKLPTRSESTAQKARVRKHEVGCTPEAYSQTSLCPRDLVDSVLPSSTGLASTRRSSSFQGGLSIPVSCVFILDGRYAANLCVITCKGSAKTPNIDGSRLNTGRFKVARWLLRWVLHTIAN